MRWHSQNLNDKPGGRYGSKLVHGRGWLYLGDWTLSLEWCLWSRHGNCRLALSFDAGQERDHTYGGHLLIGPLGLYPGLSAPRRSRFFRLAPEEARSFSISLREWVARLEVWGREWEYRSRDPWWIRGVSVDLRDLLLGRPQYSTRIVKPATSILVPMVEASYRGTAAIEEAIWKRQRWPWPRRLLRADVKMEEPVPIPGKGENSWDCGEDAIHGMSCPASTISEAVAAVVASALSSRERHGGRNWLPRAQAAPGR